jgi:carboxypeptidase family protein
MGRAANPSNSAIAVSVTSAVSRIVDFRCARRDDARMVRLYTMVLAVLCATTASAQKDALALAPPPSPATVIGTVTDSSGAPLNSAEVRLVVAGTHLGTSRTGDDGRFLIAGEFKGRSKLQVRRIGFLSREVELFFPRDTSRVLIIVLDPATEEVAGVEADDSTEVSMGRLRGFYERRRTNSLGHYFTRRDIVAKAFLSEVLRTTGGVTLTAARRTGYQIRMRGCQRAPLVWIDGGRTPNVELDEIARVDDVAAMEVYTTNSGVPAQFLDRSNGGCGVILVWTR